MDSLERLVVTCGFDVLEKARIGIGDTLRMVVRKSSASLNRRKDVYKRQVYDGSEDDEDRDVDDKVKALGELEMAHRSPYWAGRHEHYPAYYAHDVILPTGDGSIMMNLQELQTIVSLSLIHI